MLYGYFALSGEQEESAICCLGGFIAEADDWNEFDHAWKASLSDSANGFDATACFQGTGAFQSWDIRRRHRIFDAHSRERCAGSLGVTGQPSRMAGRSFAALSMTHGGRPASNRATLD